MRNKRKRQGPAWPEDHVVELLARLDLLIHSNGPAQLSGQNTESETNTQQVLTELRKGMSVTYSREQIERKLYSMYEEGDEWADHNFCKVFWFGSKDIHKLDKEMREKVSERYKNLQMTTPRQRRAIAQSRQTEDRCKPGSISVRDRRPTRTRSQKLATRTFSQNQASKKHGPLKIQHIKKRQVSLPAIEVASTEPTSQSNAKIKSDSQPEPDTSRIPEINYSHHKDSSSPTITVSTSQTPNLSYQKSCDDDAALPSNCLDMVSVPRLDYEKLLADHACLWEEYRRAEAEWKIGRDGRPNLVDEDLVADQAYYRDKYRRAEVKCETLELVDRQRTSLFAEGKGISIEMQNAMKRKSIKIAELEKQVYKQRYLRPFISPDTSPTRATNSQQLNTTYAEMKSQIISISILSGLQYPHSNAFHNQSPDLKLLLCGILCGRDHLNRHNCTSPTYNGVSANKIVQSLTGAALHEWVFCTHFQESFRCASLINTPLLDSFRTLVSSIGDTELLLGLDFATYQSVVTDEHVQKVFIPRTATRLAERFLVMLQPFIQQETNSETSSLLKQTLELIFQLAMEVKILAMISKAMYECIWPVPESVFEGDSMVIEHPESAQAPIEVIDQPISLVRLALVPGLRIWKYEKKMVDYYGFVRGEEDSLEAPEMIAKAVVLM